MIVKAEQFVQRYTNWSIGAVGWGRKWSSRATPPQASHFATAAIGPGLPSSLKAASASPWRMIP
jgi:hypothetical protein